MFGLREDSMQEVPHLWANASLAEHYSDHPSGWEEL
jgi:hypothetical protein